MMVYIQLCTNLSECMSRACSFCSGRSLTPNGNYKVKLCVSNSFGQNNCKESRLAVVDNSNRTMIVKMNGALHRRIKARGKYRFRRKCVFKMFSLFYISDKHNSMQSTFKDLS